MSVKYDKNEWQTPAKYVELVRKVLGQIDLDPASCDDAQETVRAVKYFTKENNALEQTWHGRVFMNPPYSSGMIAPFIDKFLQEHEAGRISGIVLTNNDADRYWYHRLWVQCVAFCNTRGRIHFNHPAHKVDHPRQGQTFFLFDLYPPRNSRLIHKFIDTFKAVGNISMPVIS